MPALLIELEIPLAVKAVRHNIDTVYTKKNLLTLFVLCEVSFSNRITHY